MNTLSQKIGHKVRRLGAIARAKTSAKTWPSKSIVFYTGDTPNQWSPNDLQVGIGGAEGRIIYLSKEWVKQGYAVTVYNHCGKDAGFYDGVHYLNHDQFNPYDQFDTLIVWQFAWRIKFPIKANRVWLDLGKGILLPEESTHSRLKHYDKIFCKNHFHRSTLPDIPDNQIVVIPNGVDRQFAELVKTPKTPNKLIYASNYQRGLERMLEFGWPLIIQAVPAAELHIVYGWPRNTDTGWQQKMRQLMAQPGIKERGKMGRSQLMREKATSSIHYYGCTFEELDCNTVRESALVGCVPVTTDYGGLRDKDYCIKVSGNPYTQETQEQLAQKIIDLLKHPSQLDHLRQTFFQRVQNETWETVSKLWLAQE